MVFSFYRMKNNVYMGDCFAIVCNLSDDKIYSGLTRNEIIIFVKPSPIAYSVVTDINKLKSTDNIYGDFTPILRVGSECMFGIFGDSHCECEPERRSMLRLLNERRGVYIHLPQEAQGMGLSYKAQELHLQVSGYMPDGSFIGALDQTSAAERLTGKRVIDNREYAIVSEILEELNLLQYTYEMVSKNKTKISDAKENGIRISRVLNSSTVMTADNLGEHLAKWWQKGNSLTNEDVLHMTKMLNSTEAELPPRAVNLLNEIRFTLETNESSILDKVGKIDETLKEPFIKALHSPKNPSVLGGGQLQMWSLLERAEAYNEFQYELLLTEELDDYLAMKGKPEGQVRLWHERNYYFYSPYLTTNDSRDLKIRLTYDMKEQFIEARLIHKIRKAEHFYQIRSINFSDPAIFELMQQIVFKDYDQEIVESITYPYCYSERGMKIIIKRYVDGQRTLSLEGQQSDVVNWKNTAQDNVKDRIQEVKQNKRSFAPEIKADLGIFDVEQFMKDEFMHCGRYFNYE